MGDYAASADNGVFADGDIAEDGGVGADGGPALDQGGDNGPVRFGLQVTRVRGGPGVFVIDEHNPVSDEDLIFNGHPFADKGVTGYLTVFTNRGVLLYFHKGAYFGAITDLATVKVDKVVDDDVLTENDAVSNLFHFYKLGSWEAGKLP